MVVLSVVKVTYQELLMVMLFTKVVLVFFHLVMDAVFTKIGQKTHANRILVTG